MDLTVETLKQSMSNISQEMYLFTGIVMLLIFYIIHIYSLRQERKKFSQAVSTQVKVFKKAFDTATDGMLILSDTYDVLYANKTMMNLLALEKDFQYKTFKYMPQIKTAKTWVNLDLFLNTQKERIRDNILPFPQSFLRVKEEEILINLYLDSYIEESKGNKKHYILTIQDLTQMRKSSQMEYKHKLTHLPNQIKALQDIPALFSKIHTENNKIALALMSFDNFSMLRSIIGYEQSNEVIIKFSKILSEITSNMNVGIYHTFDNHFLLTLSNVESIEDVKTLVKELQQKLATSYKMEEGSLYLSVSVGIAIYPESGPTRNLLDNTYKALASAQKDGDSNIVVYVPNKMESQFDELQLHNDMQSGLSKGEFEVYYQPIVDIKTQEITSAEALIRWIHPELGFIPPDVFIGMMEKTGFIVKLGQYVLEEVLKQQKRWELFKFKAIEVSINVSMVEIATGEFVEHVDKQLKHHQLNPECIKFEITEGMAMVGEKQTEKYFHQLKKLGVGIALDDFGTGYTSFTYLKKFPADTIKIDKSLVDHILTNEEDLRIVHAMIELGHNLGMKIVVEGVESKKMLELLSEIGCDYMQGYYFSKPLPVFEFQKLLR